MSERKRKLLLADDSVTIQKVVNLTFADEGIEVAAVGDGDAAMERFVQFAPDLVMVDVNMPGTDGYRICEMIKQDADTAHIPVILLVGSFEPFDEEEARRVGADDFLTKPFQSIRQLVGKVTALLESAAPPKSDSNSRPISAAAEESARNFQSVAGENDSAGDYEEDVIYAPSAEAETPQFGGFDADDETIQTNQIGSLPADETRRFSADFTADDAANDSPISAGEPFENSYSYETVEEDWTQQTSRAEESGAAATADANSGEYESAAFDGESSAATAEAQGSSTEISATDAEKNSGENKTAASFSPQSFSWDLDDLDLLGLHGDSRDEAPEIEEEEEPETIEIEPTEPAAPPPPPPPPQPAADISPELIEQIAARVAAKLSDRVIDALTRELVPQMSDLIAKELAEDKKVSG